jgi:hypothetical protein
MATLSTISLSLPQGNSSYYCRRSSFCGALPTSKTQPRKRMSFDIVDIKSPKRTKSAEYYTDKLAQLLNVSYKEDSHVDASSDDELQILEDTISYIKEMKSYTSTLSTLLESRLK